MEEDHLNQGCSSSKEQKELLLLGLIYLSTIIMMTIIGNNTENFNAVQINKWCKTN
jgi:hypothetical protein